MTGSQELEENAKTMHRIEELFHKNAEILGLATITLNDPTMEIKYIGAVASNSKVMVRTSSSEMLNASRSHLLQSKSNINLASSFLAEGGSYTLQPSISVKSNISTKSKKKKIVKYL